MVTKVKDSQPHTCTCAPPSIDLSCVNSCYFQAKSSCDEHVLIETCDNFIVTENNELKRENETLKMELSRLKYKGHVQQSQDNRDHMVEKLENGSTVTCVKLRQCDGNGHQQQCSWSEVGGGTLHDSGAAVALRSPTADRRSRGGG
jgi:hypothetical protein